MEAIKNTTQARANAIFNAALRDALEGWKGKLKIEYTSKNVPESGKAIHAMFTAARQGLDTFRIFDGANAADDLWFTPETNLLYRTLHDIDHAVEYSKGRGTTKLADECYLNCLMAERVYQYAMSNGFSVEDALLGFFTVYHDTVGQVHYYAAHKDFCSDQRGNTEMLVRQCLGMQALKDGELVHAALIRDMMLRACDVASV